MSDKSRQMTPEEAAEFAEQVFNKAREGDDDDERHHDHERLLILAHEVNHSGRGKVRFRG